MSYTAGVYLTVNAAIKTDDFFWKADLERGNEDSFMRQTCQEQLKHLITLISPSLEQNKLSASVWPNGCVATATPGKGFQIPPPPSTLVLFLFWSGNELRQHWSVCSIDIHHFHFPSVAYGKRKMSRLIRLACSGGRASVSTFSLYLWEDLIHFFHVFSLSSWKCFYSKKNLTHVWLASVCESNKSTDSCEGNSAMQPQNILT